MTKHTPGPWKHYVTHPLSGAVWFVVTDKDGYGPIIDVGGKDNNGQIAEAKYLITDGNEIEANARLIAAAPELLEVLEAVDSKLTYLQKLWGKEGVTDGIVDQVRAAIAKAVQS